MIFDYQITYTIDSLKDTPWTDNNGGKGVVARNMFHGQEYFPLWLESPLTFQGTLLPNNAWDKSGKGTYWVLDAYDYGYVDNKPNSDSTACSFDIDWAVDPVSRDSVLLDYVDFVRVYTGLNQAAGWLGETSTEVCARSAVLRTVTWTLRSAPFSIISTLWSTSRTSSSAPTLSCR